MHKLQEMKSMLSRDDRVVHKVLMQIDLRNCRYPVYRQPAVRPSTHPHWHFGISVLYPKWIRLALNCTKPGPLKTYKIYLNLIWKSPAFVPFVANLTSLQLLRVSRQLTFMVVSYSVYSPSLDTKWDWHTFSDASVLFWQN